ncbi:MAG: DUF21 domain-containing protein, partial [Proteobacteria bacterium]|nr:DUF21 domain-containing protein [Pseudomonadota bacterium]
MDSIFSNPYLIRWLAMGGLVLLVAFFAMSETSLFSLSPLDRLRLKEKQPARGGVVEDILSRPRRLLVTVLIGVETSSIMFSVLATSMVLSLWGPHGEWRVLLVMVLTSQFLGEIIPKSLALAYPVQFAGRMAPLIRPMIFILSPFRVVFLQISRGILVALGFRPDLP